MQNTFSWKEKKKNENEMNWKGLAYIINWRIARGQLEEKTSDEENVVG